MYDYCDNVTSKGRNCSDVFPDFPTCDTTFFGMFEMFWLCCIICFFYIAQIKITEQFIKKYLFLFVTYKS